MNKKISIFLSILLISCFLLPTALASPKKKKKQEVASVSGQVVNVEGVPVAGALVTAMEGTQIAYTKEDGTFTVRSGVADYICIEAEDYETRNVYLPEMAKGGTVVLEKTVYKAGMKDRIALPFGELADRNVVGAVDCVRISDYDGKYNSSGYKTILEFAGMGMCGSGSFRGQGYTVMVDGLIRDGNTSLSSFTDMMLADEIEDITILKDSYSRLLYGSYADKGIIMIRTKRGQAHKRNISVRYESDFGLPVSYPSYLEASDYMILYNEARRNDGLEDKYSYDEISAARSGDDPVRYPTNNYFNNTYLKNFKPQHRVAAEFSGGNRDAQYFLNVGWYNTSSIIGIGQAQSTNRFNVRGNVDVRINDYIKVSLDAVAIFNAYKGANYKNSNFWDLAVSDRVNSNPLLIPIERISDLDKSIIDEAFAQRSVIDGKYLLGGNNSFTQNMYGDLYLGGYSNTTDRMAQVNVGIDVDFKFITEGLKFKTWFANDNYNKYSILQTNSYAVYNPVFKEDGSIRVEKIGVNDFVGKQDIKNVSVYRRLGWYNVLGYDRTFGEKHSVSALLNSVMHHYKQTGAAYTDKSVNFGGRVNYMYDGKFVAEYSGAYIGSSRFAASERWTYAQGGGLGWIVSGHDFLRNSEVVDWLKVRASFAHSRTDFDINGYHAFEDIFTNDGKYNYGDGAGANVPMEVTKGNPDLSWTKKNDVNVGMDLTMFDRQLYFTGNWYYTYRYDEPVKRTSTLPSYIGGSLFTPYENYGASSTQGVELRLGWNRHFGDFGINLMADASFYSPEAVIVDEVNYGPGLEYLQKSGKAADAMWGYVAQGLYTQEEVDAINDPSNTDVVRPTFGEVKAGDIKYKNLNNDKVIDDYDMTVIGHSQVRANYGLTVDLQYKNFGLFIYAYARKGASRYFNGDYYHVYGEKKYPTHLTGRWAYDPENGIDNREGATHPRLTTLQNENNAKNSTWWIRSTDHFSLADVQLTYTFGPTMLKAMRLKGLMLYVKGQNLLTLGPNVKEMQLNVGSEPQYRYIAIGLNVKF